MSLFHNDQFCIQKSKGGNNCVTLFICTNLSGDWNGELCKLSGGENLSGEGKFEEKSEREGDKQTYSFRSREKAKISSWKKYINGQTL